MKLLIIPSILLIVLTTGVLASPFDSGWERQRTSQYCPSPGYWAECLVKWDPHRDCPVYGIYGRSSQSGEKNLCFVPGHGKKKIVDSHKPKPPVVSPPVVVPPVEPPVLCEWKKTCNMNRKLVCVQGHYFEQICFWKSYEQCYRDYICNHPK